MTGGSPTAPGSCLKAVGELGAPLVVPSNPNGRRGRRARSPIRQGRVAMDMITVGIDVSKDRLDVAVCPSGEAFVVERDAAGLERLATRLRQIAPQIVALEATGNALKVARLLEPHVARVVVAPTKELSAITTAKVKADRLDGASSLGCWPLVC